MLTGKYSEYYNRLQKSIPAERLITDELRKLAFGTDGSFYRLIPKLVVKVESDDEVKSVITYADELDIPITFRAAGTSLSGQAITDSVLVLLGTNWRSYKILDEGNQIKMQAGMVGAFANLYLSPYNKKLGSDPASINSAMISGIAANNASGMTSGTENNIYNKLAGMKIILADGAILDTTDEASKKDFTVSNSEFVEKISALSKRVKANTALSDRIKFKYRMKNTTGFGLNALVDFEDPFDIISHLMIGSEGTLGFMSEITVNTIDEFPHKATSLMLFNNIESACNAIPIFRKLPVNAAEIMDRAALRSVQDKPGMPEQLKLLKDSAAALLVETSAHDEVTLQNHIQNITNSISNLPKSFEIEFITDQKEAKKLWDVRKGLFPSACKSREPGTTVIIEDVNFPVERLAEAVLDVQAMFKKYDYSDTIIWGHSLAGNIHFVLTQNFDKENELKRYQNFMDDLAKLVVKKYDGSLKAEHGTGRNMAPYVRYEWGGDAYELMHEIKNIFDPKNILNPGVILNADPKIHLKNLKSMPIADELIDQCIECGFCEVNCPSKNSAITPRQRITVWREIANLKATCANPERLKELKTAYNYYGDEMCAADGLCAASCPVDIDTGKLIKKLRTNNSGKTANSIAGAIANNISAVTALTRFSLNAVYLFQRILGDNIMTKAGSMKKKIFGRNFPLWNKYMPKGADKFPVISASGSKLKVVYFPSCISRSMGCAKGDGEDFSQTTVMINLLKKAGYEIIFPSNLNNLCCGMAFSSKGFVQQGMSKSDELFEALKVVSENNSIPVLFDTSPCTYHFKDYLSATNKNGKDGLKIYEPIDFTLEFVMDKLRFQKIPGTVAIHTTCSSTKMGLGEKFKMLADACAENVIVPAEVGCCGWAGDRGFTYPELNSGALLDLKKSLPAECKEGYSTSRTCEIGLSLHSGIHYKSIVYLVDKCTEAK